MVRYNKLVRDKIPDLIRGRYRIHIAGRREYQVKLIAKLQEEIKEFEKAKKRIHRIEEMADILEVVDAIIKHQKFNLKKLKSVKDKKKKERGGFKKRIILEQS